MDKFNYKSYVNNISNTYTVMASKDIRKSKPELSDMIRWWRRDGGSFNTELYIKICVIKAQER